MSRLDDKRVAEAEERAALQRRELRQSEYEDAFKWLASDRRGRIVIARFLKENFVDPSSNKTAFTGNSKTYEFLGQQKAAKGIETEMIRLCPESYILMLKEQFIKQEYTE